MKSGTVRRGILSLVALTVLLTAGACGAEQPKAPDFTLTDQNGAKQPLSKLQGKVVGLYFWATYCPTCAASFPAVERLSDDYRRRGVVILGINTQLSELAARFQDRKGYRLRTLHDSYSKVSKSYGIYGIPVLVLIDRNGAIARRFVGQVPEKEVRAAIDRLLRGSVASAAPKPSSGVCEIVKLDTPPIRSSGRILVPMRPIFQWFGASVKWSEKARSVAAKKGSRSLEITVGSREARVGGKSVSLDAPARMVRGRVYVPLRFVGQALGVKVEYRPQDGGILLKSGSRCGFVAVE